ncbi:hypothetical protein ACQ4WX_39260 [Streptomyces lasalocidi]
MGACDLPVMDTVCNTIGGVVGSTGEAVTDGIGAWIAKSMGELAQAAADLASKAVDKTTAIDLNAEWFRSNYELILPIGLVLTVGTFCLQLTRAAWRRDERALVQAVYGTVAGVLFAFAAIACTTVALTVVDALSRRLVQGGEQFGGRCDPAHHRGQRPGSDVRVGLDDPRHGRPRVRCRCVPVLGRDGRPQGRHPDPGDAGRVRRSTAAAGRLPGAGGVGGSRRPRPWSSASC